MKLSEFVTQKKSKYRNKPTVYNGRTYPSKLQAKHAKEYDMLVRSEKIVSWIPEISIPLTAPVEGKRGVRMRVDALIVLEVYPNGEFLAKLEDSKGTATQDWENKNKFLREKYGIEVIQRKR